MTISEATLPNAVGLKLVNPPLGPTKTSSGGAGAPVFADAWAHELGGVWDGKPMYDWLFRKHGTGASEQNEGEIENEESAEPFE